jgi:hypothetical protein
MFRIFIFIIFSIPLFAQNFEKIIPEEKILERDGMIFLTSWAGVNIAGGSAAYFMAREPEWKYFHEMNVFWNTVNLGLGIAGLCNSVNKKKHNQDKESRIKQLKKTEKIFLVNTGLDILYISSGFAMKHFADKSDNPARFNGYGNALIMQGTFLFLFDGIEYFLLRNFRQGISGNKSLSIKTEGLGLSLKIQF